MKIVFFNQFHNGDCFVGKGWVKNIIDQLPEAEFGYAHNNHPTLIQDLAVQHLSLNQIPAIDRMTRLGQGPDGTIYINTWCGAFQGELFGYDQHSNFIIQHQIYDYYCRGLSQALGRTITQSGSVTDYLPFIDASYYRQDLVQAFVDKLTQPLVLFCNGPANSGQSAMGDMRNIIDQLSAQYSGLMFAVTHRLDLKKPNIVYTDDIFGLESDINEIALLSQHARLIVGKNSGPYTFCHYQKNLNVNDKTLFCFGKSLTDCLNAGLSLPAASKFSNQINDTVVTAMLNRECYAIDNDATFVASGMQYISQ